MKLNNAIASKNLYGLIGVEPIRFNMEEFLNSNTVWGIKTNNTHNDGIR